MSKTVKESGNKQEVVNTAPKFLWDEWEKVCSRFKGVSGLDKIFLVPGK